MFSEDKENAMKNFKKYNETINEDKFLDDSASIELTGDKPWMICR
ncbi:MAG: hypothetical protein K0R31_1255 [Clostridiales bacterium]|nr:hypothetical protein [Clostridiales bacterium]